MHKVTDIMNRKILRTTAGQTVAKAATEMRDHDTRSMAVEEDGKFVGVLSWRDIAIQAIVISATTTVRDVMDDCGRCCRDDEDADAVTRMMAEAGITRLPVVDGRQHVVGFVTLHGPVDAAGPKRHAARATH